MKSLSLFIQLIRPKEWVKNVFLFAPLFFTPALFHIEQTYLVLIGVILFSIVASSIYILNDLKDSEADRLHPIKKRRPISSGKINSKTARLFFVIFSVIGLVGSALLSPTFFLVIIIYYLINVAYCFWLKHISIIDIYCVAAGFILRIVAGAVLINVIPSVWILMCTGLLALFLALAKRRDDLVSHVDETHRVSMRGYNLNFIDISMVMVLSTLFIAYTVYTTSNFPEINLGTTHFYWTVPIVLLGILRYLQITLVEKKSGSPTELVFTDRFLLCTLFVWLIFSTALIY